MQKQELIHLHALCVELRAYFEDRHNPPSGAFQSYEQFGVSPMAVHRPKQFHEKALFHLLDGLATVIENQPGLISPDRLSTLSDK